MTVDEIEIVLLRSIVERRETCRQAAEHVANAIALSKSRQQYAEDELKGRNT